MDTLMFTRKGWTYTVLVKTYTPATPTKYYNTPDGLEQDLGDEGELVFTVVSIDNSDEFDYESLLSNDDLDAEVWTELSER